MSVWKTLCMGVGSFSQLQLSRTSLSHHYLSSGGTDGFQLSVFHICHANLSGVRGKEVGFQVGICEEVPITCTTGLYIAAKALWIVWDNEYQCSPGDSQLSGDVTGFALSWCSRILNCSDRGTSWSQSISPPTAHPSCYPGWWNVPTSVRFSFCLGKGVLRKWYLSASPVLLVRSFAHFLHTEKPPWCQLVMQWKEQESSPMFRLSCARSLSLPGRLLWL